MNNILVKNDNISFENEEKDLIINTKILTINIKGNVILNEINANSSVETLIININKDSCLNYNYYNINKEKKIDIIINISDNAKFYGNIGIIAHEEQNLSVETFMNGNNITNILNIKIITKDMGSTNILVNGHVLKNTRNNIMRESINVLNENNSTNRILPNMLVSSSEVMADHFVTISNCFEDELFYLESKGINKMQAYQLIEQGFILEIFDERLQNIIIGGE